MPNVIELVNKYLPILDEQYRIESKSAILDTPGEFVQQTKEAKKVKIAKINVDGLVDYSRQNGFTSGSMELTWEEHEFRIDRGRSLQVDSMDNLETFGLAWGRLAGTFQRDKVVPEIDAYRFSQYYKRAGYKKTVALSEENVLSVIDDIDAHMDDNEVPENGRMIFCNPTIYKYICNDKTIAKSLSVDDTMTKALNKKVYSYNGKPIIKVPSNRFYTAINLLTGDENTAGGYEAAAGAKVIGMLILSKDVVIQISKRAISRFWAPTRAEMDATKADGVNPTADAWKFDFRTYHDAWVLDNKMDAIAAVVAESTGVTSVDISTADEDVSLAGSAGARTAAVSLANVDAFKADANVVVTGGASTAVDWKTSNKSVATVDASGNVTILKAGSATITAVSVYDPTKKATLALTIS